MLNIDMFVVLAHNFDSQILHIKERDGRRIDSLLTGGASSSTAPATTPSQPPLLAVTGGLHRKTHVEPMPDAGCRLGLLTVIPRQ
jgi:hypothetical protein